MTMIDLSSPEPKDAEHARCYVIHEQNILIAADQWQLPVMPAYMLRQHPHYFYLGLLNGEPCYVCELVNHELDDGSLQPVPLRQLISGGLACSTTSLQEPQILITAATNVSKLIP